MAMAKDQEKLGSGWRVPETHYQEASHSKRTQIIGFNCNFQIRKVQWTENSIGTRPCHTLMADKQGTNRANM